METRSSAPLINVVLCGSDSIHYAFAVAAIANSLASGMDPIAIVDVIPALLESEELFRKNVVATIKDYSGNVSAADPPYPERINLYLIDVGPRNDQDVASLIDFVDRHETEIVLWLDTKFNWQKSEMAYMNNYKRILEPDRDKTPLQLLRDRGYQPLDSWLEAERLLISGNWRQIGNNPLAKRYHHAFQAARVIDDSSPNNQRLICFFEVTDELIYQRTSRTINGLNKRFYKMVEETNKVKWKISASSGLFPLMKERQRTAGYINLGKLSNLVDANELLAYGKTQFPWLCVMEYQINKNYYIDAISAKVDITQILSGPAIGKPAQLKKLIKDLDAKVADYKEIKITTIISDSARL